MHALPATDRIGLRLAIRWCRFRSATTRSRIFKPRHTSMGSRRFMRIRSFRFRCALEPDGRAAAHYPARARPGQPLAAGFFQPAAAQVPPDLVRHQQELMGPVSQFLTGLFPAVFGGEMESQKTATGYAMARDQAMGRLGLVWRRLKQFYSDVMLLSVDCFRKIGLRMRRFRFWSGGEFESHWIRLADLKGIFRRIRERRNFSAFEIAAARCDSTIDGVVGSAYSAGAR